MTLPNWSSAVMVTVSVPPAVRLDGELPTTNWLAAPALTVTMLLVPLIDTIAEISDKGPLLTPPVISGRTIDGPGQIVLGETDEDLGAGDAVAGVVVGLGFGGIQAADIFQLDHLTPLSRS